MSESDRVEAGSGDLPEVLRTLAGVLPQFVGEDLESQLQTYDTFLSFLSPMVRPEIAALLKEAASKTQNLTSRERIWFAAESVERGGRAAEPYDHSKAMKEYQEKFRQENLAPAASTETAEKYKEETVVADVEVFRARIKRRAIVMEIGGFRPPEDPKTSWFGKVGFALPGEEWPKGKNDTPMIPLAQINLTELPFRPPHLEDILFLTVFVDPGAVIEEMAAWSLRAYSSLDELVALKVPENLETKINALPMRPKVIEEDYPCHEDLPEGIPEEFEDTYLDEFKNVSGFKLGGWPTLIQSEIYWVPGNEHPAKPEFIFQIDSTEEGGWQWGDGGVGYFGRGTAPGYEDMWFLVSQFY